MRYVVVRRVTLSLGAALVLYAAAFAWLVRDEAAASATDPRSVREGASLFQRYCASCHAAGDLTQQLQEGGADRRRSFEQFLRGHGDATDADDRLILDYLALPGAP